MARKTTPEKAAPTKRDGTWTMVDNVLSESVNVFVISIKTNPSSKQRFEFLWIQDNVAVFIHESLCTPKTTYNADQKPKGVSIGSCEDTLVSKRDKSRTVANS